MEINNKNLAIYKRFCVIIIPTKFFSSILVALRNSSNSLFRDTILHTKASRSILVQSLSMLWTMSRRNFISSISFGKSSTKTSCFRSTLANQSYTENDLNQMLKCEFKCLSKLDYLSKEPRFFVCLE